MAFIITTYQSFIAELPPEALQVCGLPPEETAAQEPWEWSQEEEL